MRKILFGSAIALVTGFMFSCQKSDNSAPEADAIPQDVINKVKALGLTTANLQKTDGGYIAEGDIFLDDEILNSTPEHKFLVVADEEHYRTTNLVTAPSTGQRTITVRYSGTTTSISNAINAAITRYNNENLRIRFSRVTSGGNIVVSNVSGVAYIASAGFPSGGNPYNAIRFNTAYAGWTANTLTSVMAHEMGHCIGFRHTDYACRQYSCGGSPVNEGSAGIGAIHIPGTPTACNGDPTSWMLACIGNGTNRPFNTNDRNALNYLY